MFDFFNSFHPGWRIFKQILQNKNFILDFAFHQQHRLQGREGGISNSSFLQFQAHFLQSYLIQFVNGNCNIGHLLRSANCFGNACKDLTVIEDGCGFNAQAGKYFVYDLDKFNLIQQ